MQQLVGILLWIAGALLRWSGHTESGHTFVPGKECHSRQ